MGGGAIRAQIHKTQNISSYNAVSTAEVIQFNAMTRTGTGMQMNLQYHFQGTLSLHLPGGPEEDHE
jgi:hypothetical protein